MKEQGRLKWVGIVCGVFVVLVLLLQVGPSVAQSTDKTTKFEAYRTAIKSEFGIDIKDFKEQLKGGRSDGKGPIQGGVGSPMATRWPLAMTLCEVAMIASAHEPV